MNVTLLKALTEFIYELKYDDSQPRDDSGRWSDGGGGGGGSSGNVGSESGRESSGGSSGTVGKNKDKIIANLKKKGLTPQIKKGSALKRDEVFIDDDSGVWIVSATPDPINGLRAAKATAPYSDGSGLFSQGERHFSISGNYISAGTAKQYARTLIKPRY